MPSFEIPDGPTTLALKTEGGFHNGKVVFNVTNKTGEGLTARFNVQIQGNGKSEWYAVEGEPERPVAAGETQTVTVVAKIPAPPAPVSAPPPAPAKAPAKGAEKAPAAPPAKPPAGVAASAAAVAAAVPSGQHQIKLRAVNVNDPDNDSTDSAAVTVTIPAAPKPADKKPFPLWIIAVIAGVLVVVVGVIIAIVLLSGGGSKAPDVSGLTYEAAVAALKDKGFNDVAPPISEATTEKPPGQVFKQDPLAGAKADPKKTQVKLTVAAAATVEAPSVTGLDYATAAAAFEKAGFKVDPAIEEVSGEKAPGLVFKQEPQGGAQADPKAGNVKLTVAVGETVSVPSVAGKVYIAAQALLEDRGFKVTRVVGKPSGQAPDVVQFQDPVGETAAPKGGLVTLTTDPGVTVPNLSSPQVNFVDGVKILQNAGLDIGSISSNCAVPANKISAQSIAPNTQVARGTRVNVTVGTSASTAVASSVNIAIRCISLAPINAVAIQTRAVNATALKATALSVNGAKTKTLPK